MSHEKWKKVDENDVAAALEKMGDVMYAIPRGDQRGKSRAEQHGMRLKSVTVTPTGVRAELVNEQELFVTIGGKNRQ